MYKCFTVYMAELLRASIFWEMVLYHTDLLPTFRGYIAP